MTTQTQTLSERLELAKEFAMLKNEFYGAQTAAAWLVSCPSLTSPMATDGVKVYYNPTMCSPLLLKYLACLVTHEKLHDLLLHSWRLIGIDQLTRNIAFDYEVNAIMVEAGWELLPGMLYNAAFRGMAAEDILKHLPKKPPQTDPGKGPNKDKGKGDSQGDSNKGWSWSRHGLYDEVKNAPEGEVGELAKEEHITQLAQTAYRARQAGMLPQFIDRIMQEVKAEAHIPWGEVLRQWATEVIRYGEEDWTEPNSGYLAMGVIAPSRRSKSSKIALCKDISGSIDDVQSREFDAQLVEMTAMLNLKVTVVPFTHIVHEDCIVEVEPGESVPEMERKYWGGTDFVPPFQWLIDNDTESRGVIVLTDGCCWSFPAQEPLPTLWVIYNRDCGEFKPPWGEVVYLSDYKR